MSELLDRLRAELAESADAIECLLIAFVRPRPEGESAEVTRITRECHVKVAEAAMEDARKLLAVERLQPAQTPAIEELLRKQYEAGGTMNRALVSASAQTPDRPSTSERDSVLTEAIAVIESLRYREKYSGRRAGYSKAISELESLRLAQEGKA